MWKVIFIVFKWIGVIVGGAVMIYHYKEIEFVIMMLVVLESLRCMNDDLQDEIKKQDEIIKGLREKNSKMSARWKELRERFQYKVH